MGTTSVKTAVFDETLTECRRSMRDYTLTSFGDRVEFPAEDYWHIVREEIAAARAEIGVDALAIDTQCETLILTDEEGKPVRPAIVWLDNRATEEAAMIEAHFGKQRVYEVTGQPEVTATWPACKLLWIKRNEPEVWARTKRIFLLEDYILYKLTGRFATEKTLQSSTIYFDIKTGDWWGEMLDFIGVSRRMLPALLDSGVPLGRYDGIDIVTGAMDQVAGAIGAGVVEPGIVSVMTGTTMVIFTPSDKIPPFDPASIVPCHYNWDGSYCLLSWSPTAGMALKWFKNALCEGQSFRELDDLAASVPPGSAGVTFLPYLCGSTMPRYNPDARGSFTGLTTEHGRGHFVRSVMESIACTLRANLEYLGLEATEIRAMGGGASSPFWCQMKADITKKRLATLKNGETACLGAAILAGVGVGTFPSVGAACKRITLGHVFTPSGTDYTACYERFKAMDACLNK